MRHVNQPGDVPGRAVSGRRNIEAGGQVGVLINRDTRPRPGGRRGDVEHAAGAVGVVGGCVEVPSPIGSGEHDRQGGTGGGPELVRVEIELTVFNNENGGLANGRVDGHIAGEQLVAAYEI